MNYPEGFIKFDIFDKQLDIMLNSDEDLRLLFVGAPGTGKSWLARFVMKALMEKRNADKQDLHITSASELYRKYLSMQSSSVSDKAEILDTIAKTLVLQYVIIDDLGNEINSQAGNTYFAELFSYQYDRIIYAERRKPINTIITTNFSGNELSRLYGTRIIDRIYETYTIFQFNNESFRKGKMKVFKN